jgi:hypothetical protein
MGVFLLAGLLDIAFGVAFLAAPVPPEIQELKTGNANMELQTTRGERVPPGISFLLLASGITLIATTRPGRRKPEPLSCASSITCERPGNTTP